MLCIWLLGTLALLVKHNAVVVVYALFVWLFGVRRGVLALLLSSLVFVLSFAPYTPVGSAGMLRNVFLYRGMIEPYGLLVILPGAVNTALMALAMLTVPLLARRLPLQDALLVSVLAWLVTTSGIGVQYFMVLLIVGSLNPRNTGWLLGIGGLVALIEVDMLMPGQTLPLPVLRVAWAALWLVCALWLTTLMMARLPRRVRVSRPAA